MITVNAAHQCSIEEIEHAIEERRVLISQMVGTLYPSILKSEISRLNIILSEKKREQMDVSNNG